jgi:hypothetical protein
MRLPLRAVHRAADQPDEERGPGLRTALSVVAGVVTGGLLGLVAGIYLSCGVFYKGENLCGLVGVFVTGPFGAVAGGIGGWLLSRRG